MACPTCDHTMETIAGGKPGDPATFYCPRCGTLSEPPLPFPPFLRRVTKPALVDRVQSFARSVTAYEILRWMETLGIFEALHTPKERPFFASSPTTTTAGPASAEALAKELERVKTENRVLKERPPTPVEVEAAFSFVEKTDG